MPLIPKMFLRNVAWNNQWSDERDCPTWFIVWSDSESVFTHIKPIDEGTQDMLGWSDSESVFTHIKAIDEGTQDILVWSQ